MKTLLFILTGLIALEHLYFMYLEMFLWTRPKGMKAFGTDQEFARKSRVLAANQGLYNGFLAAGLIWAMFVPDTVWSKQISIFFLACIIAAGIFGALSTKKAKLFYLQACPALITLILTLINQ